MKSTILAAAAAALVASPFTARADVGVYEETPVPERRVYTERTERYVEPAPAYREEVRVYRTVPTYTTRVYREVPVVREVPIVREVPVIREAPYYREHRVEIVPPAPHRVIRHIFGHW